MTNYKIKNQSKTSSHKPLFYSLVILLLLATAGIYYLAHNKHSAPHTASELTKGEPTQPTKSGQSTNSNNPSAPNAGSAPSTTNNNVTVIEPTGDFVSAHHVQSDSQLASVCNSSPGVNCIISFSFNGITKSLPSMKTDAGGSAYWNNWTPRSLGLTTGSWQITATASSGGQTKSGTDSLLLEVSE